MTQEELTDKRAQRTRHALLGAFFGLVLERRYDQIKIADVLERSGVGRSTFYEHFRNKDALLADSLSGPFSVLADALRPDADPEALMHMLEHFWQSRAVARGILTGAVRPKAARVLVGLIEQRLVAIGCGRAGALRLPRRLVAIQLAESLLAPLTAWLAGEVACASLALAQALQSTSVATLAALRRGSA